MNIQYNFTDTGGFPMDQGVLNDLQNGILLSENALASFLGPLAIISGCAVSGTTAASGVVAINGQILPFNGGTITAKVIIVENDTDLVYFNGSTPPTNITRYATFGDDGVQNNPWTSFVTLSASGNLWQTGDVKAINVTEGYITANFDGTGLGINLRAGWAICNGSNGTPNWLGKTPVQRDTTQTEFAAMGTTGGEKVHALSEEELPVVNPINGFDIKKGGGGAGTGGLSGTDAPTGDYPPGGFVAPFGGGETHNNLQPYITTLFIQKL